MPHRANVTQQMAGSKQAQQDNKHHDKAKAGWYCVRLGFLFLLGRPAKPHRVAPLHR